MGVVISYVAALILNAFGVTNPDGSAILNFTAVASAKLVGLPAFQLCKFDITAILVMAPIAIASMMEHVGDMSAISATVEENFIEDPGLHRTLMGDGLATAFAGLVGGPANTTYGENTSVVGMSRVASIWVIATAALISISMSFFGVVASVISTIPSPVLGGVSMILYGFISINGLKVLIENKVNYNNLKNVIITSTMLILGLGGAIVTFSGGDLSVSLTGMSLAAIVGIIMNLILNPAKDEIK
jgi:uracil permease